MASNIRVFLQWKDATVFAGEDIECTITFKNVAALPSTDRSPTRRQNGFLAAVERQQRRNPSLRPPSKPSLSRNSSYGQQLPAQHTKGHRPTLSLSTSATTVPSVSNNNTPASALAGHSHGRSLSIVSLGNQAGYREGPERTAPPTPRRPARGHGRSASLQVVPGRSVGSPHISSSRAQSATQTPTVFSVASPALSNLNQHSPGPKKQPASNGRRSSRALSPPFKFPPEPENADTPMKKEPTPSSEMPPPPRPPRSRGHTPRPAEEQSLSGDTLSPVTRILSGTSMNGTPRSSGEFYSLSNQSTETLPSEYISQPTDHLLTSHARRPSQAPQVKTGPETLMMGYAQVMGSFTLDGSLVNQAPFQEVKRKGVLGGQGGGGVVGVERTKRDSGLFGSLGWGNIGESLGDLLGTSEPSSIREMRGIANSKTVPLLTTPQSILFVDLRLAPGESRSYQYSFTLPRGLPPSHKGRAVKVTYNLSIGTQRPGSANGQQQIRHVDVPFRVFGGVTGKGEVLGHDLMSPYIVLRDEARTHSIDDDDPVKPRKKPSKHLLNGSGSDEFLNYVGNLLATPKEASYSALLSPTTEDVPRRKSSSADEQPQSIKEAIDFAILRSNTAAFSQSSNRFEIARSGHRVATIHLARPAYRLGETVSAVIDFTNADIPTYSVLFSLETAETVDPAIALRSPSSIYRATRKVHAAYFDNALYSQRLTFAPTIPPNATPDFVTSGVSLEWKLRVEFTTPRLTAEEIEEGAWTDILEEVVHDDRGIILAAAEKLPCESFEVSVPLRIYGAVTGGVENPSLDGLAV